MKVLKWLAIVLLVLVLALWGGFQWIISNTKKLSPEGQVAFKYEQYDVEIKYNRPSVRGRTIFGELVPYGEVWRTGANEATTFSTKTDLELNGKTLPAGEYTLWTIPNRDSWTFIFNSKQYPWGVGFWDGKPSRDPQYDVLQVDGFVMETPKIIETLSINLVQTDPGFELQLAWETKLVRLQFLWFTKL